VRAGDYEIFVDRGRRGHAVGGVGEFVGDAGAKADFESELAGFGVEENQPSFVPKIMRGAV